MHLLSILCYNVTMSKILKVVGLADVSAGCTILCSGTSSIVAFDAAPIVTVDDMAGGSHFAGYDDSALSSPAFRVLRATVSSWVRDVSLHNNKFADQQMIHFYR